MKVLLTGGSGFLAGHCIDQLLQRNHNVVFTARSDEKGQQILKRYLQTPRSVLDYIIVEDVARESAFDQALGSQSTYEAVLHTASPFTFNVGDFERDLLNPAINGTKTILKVTKRLLPTVKRVVITSSFVAMMNLRDPPAVYTDSDWNPVTWDQALQDPFNAYSGSKTFAEKAAWDFVQQEQPKFDIAVVNPPLIFGPTVDNLTSPGSVNTSNERIQDLILGKFKDGPPPSPNMLWVDVRDAAMAHVKAMETPDAGGKRFLIAAGFYNVQQLANIIRHNFPDLADKMPAEAESDPKEDYGYDDARSRDLLGVTYRTLTVSVCDTVKNMHGKPLN